MSTMDHNPFAQSLSIPLSIAVQGFTCYTTVRHSAEQDMTYYVVTLQ